MDKRLVLIYLCITIGLLTGCENKKDDVNSNENTVSQSSIEIEANKEDSEIIENIIKTPDKDEVFRMKDIVLEGMKEYQITRMTEVIKTANLALEHAKMYDNLFIRLQNPKDLYWNYIDCTGSFQIEWAFEDGIEYDEKNSDLTEEEFNEKYGKRVLTESEFDAEAFTSIMEELSLNKNSESLKKDFAQLISYMKVAKDTHDVENI